MNDIYTWPNDLYPLVKKRFELRYDERMDLISQLAGIVEQAEVDYRLEGVGGFGELPEYNGTLHHSDQKRSFITTITPIEHAIAATVSYKKAKIDMSGEAQKTGTRLADSAYMTVLNSFYRLFENAFTTTKLADGKTWAAKDHPINTDKNAKTFSNLISETLSVSAITEAQKLASGFLTPDGLPLGGNYDLLLVSPDLESKAREICGPDAKLCPKYNPDGSVFAANPVYGLKYFVVGGGGIGLSGDQWALADSMMIKEILKLVYITKPTVLVATQDNPLVTDYIGYVDYAFGVADARAVIFSNP